MHGYSRLGTGRPKGVNSPSPPSSPRLRHSRAKASPGGSFRGPTLQSSVERIVYILLSAVFRRRGVLLFAPLLYISVMLLYMSSLSFDVVRRGGSGGGERPQPGSLYRSPQVFERLWPFMQAEGNAGSNSVLFSTSKLL